MIVDTSGLLAALVADQRLHHKCATVPSIASERIVSPFVLAEIDHLLLRIGGVGAELAMLGELVSSAYSLAPFNRRDVALARKVISHCQDRRLGFADASLVVLADRYQTDTILTLDQRHFRAVTGLSGRPFRLLPADL